MNNTRAAILSALVVFIIIQALGIYIMGGFDRQTIFSKLNTCLLAVIFSIITLAIIKNTKK
jgi:hypothetical protein